LTGSRLNLSCPKAAGNRARQSVMCSMTTYLLDTNACIALINGTPKDVRRRFQRAVARESVILLSSIVAFELWYGVAKSQRKESNAQRLEAFFTGPLEWTVFDEEDARAAGAVRAKLETTGTSIGAYDVLLAGQARRRGATLVTSNVGEFRRVAGLKWKDWAVPRR
jgi:tRNA(fMet)-specific endonuclease VapC